MLVLKYRQRTYIANTVRELANIAAGAMVFGRFVSDRPFSVWWALAGVGLWVCFLGFGVTLVKRSEP